MWSSCLILIDLHRIVVLMVTPWPLNHCTDCVHWHNVLVITPPRGLPNAYICAVTRRGGVIIDI